MSAERTPHTEKSLMARALVAVARLSIRRPWLTLGLALLLTVASIVVSATRMDYHTSRAALISPQSPYHQRWLEYTKEFGDKEDVVIVVEGPSRPAIVPVLEQIAARIRREPRLFHSVLHDEIDLAKIRSKGLYHLPLQSVQTIDRSLAELAPILEGDWSLLSPQAMGEAVLEGLAAARAGSGPLAPDGDASAARAMKNRLGPMYAVLATAVDPSGRYHSPWSKLFPSNGLPEALPEQPGRPANDRFGFVVLKLCDDTSGSFIQNAEAIASLKAIVAEARKRYPGFRFGLTGLPVMEHDEMRSSQNSTIVAGVLEFAGLVLVLVAGYGGLRHSLLAMSSLGLGMIWAFGYVALVIGHLNILSSAFAAILIGLGLNYGIYSVAGYLYLRGDRLPADKALVGTAGSVAPGITVGAVTTAIAFFVAGFTDFPGVAELGLVAGGGIVLCWLAAVTVLPAIVHLVDEKLPRRPLPAPLDFRLWINPLLSCPRRVIAIGLFLTALVSLGMAGLRYDHNLLHLQPAGLESVEWEERLLAESNRGAWFAVSMADTPQELLARKAAFLRLASESRSVDRVEEIASLLPVDSALKQPAIQRIAQRLAHLPEQPPRIPVPAQEQLAGMLGHLRAALAAMPGTGEMVEPLAALAESVNRLPSNEFYPRLSGAIERAAGELLDRLHALRAVANPEPPQWTDLPQGLVDRFVGRSGKLLLRVYGKGSLWDMDAMERFVRDVRSVDPKATGNPMQVYEASRQMQRSYQQAAIYAILIIIPFVFLDFRSLRDTFLAVLPLALGMVQLFGLMGLLDIPMNAANIIALPLMLGMAVDNGVHIMHDFRGQRGRYEMSHSTCIAVVLDSVTTMVGFAVLMVADHRGLQSLGRVMTIGMACCLFSSLIILPAILVLTTRNRPEDHRVPQPEEAEEELASPSALGTRGYRGDPPHRPRPFPRPTAGATSITPRSRDPSQRG